MFRVLFVSPWTNLVPSLAIQVLPPPPPPPGAYHMDPQKLCPMGNTKIVCVPSIYGISV